jgi:hypothetical protein
MLNLFARKNFSEKVKLRIIKKTAKCQMCGLTTECGEFAHIVASGRDGPRNKHQLVREGVVVEDYEINSETNGLYLCANCHTLIDKYPDRYTYESLIKFKYPKETPQTEETNETPQTEETNETPQTEETNETPQTEETSETPQTEETSETPQTEETSETPQTEKTNETPQKVYDCVMCQKNFTTNCRLKYHLEHNVCQKPRSTKCEHCGHLFKTKKMLEYHLEHKVCQKKNSKLELKPYHTDPQKENERLKLEIAMLRGENKSLKEHPRVINNTYNCIGLVSVPVEKFDIVSQDK